MRIGLLVPSIGDFAQAGFYNAQEIGLAKAMDSMVDELIVYKLVSQKQAKHVEKITECKNSSISFLPAKSYGTNGVMNTDLLDRTLDALIFFSDTQFSVPKVYQWARNNDVELFPYIGVIESHSNSRFKKLFVNLMFKRNLKVYKKVQCFVKTPTVKNDLEELGVKNTIVAPAGLDLELMKVNYKDYNPMELKKKYGYKVEDKVILFIGRLIKEKQPLRMIEIFSEIYKKDASYRLLIIGSGELKSEAIISIKEKKLEKQAKIIDKIPNKDIWELYRLAHCFVNLNQQEIFGMAILEAMYYECKVVAWEAPGPSFIIENGITGYICNANNEVREAIMNNSIVNNKAKEAIVRKFFWEATANQFIKTVF